jgi:hypothetical protein
LFGGARFFAGEGIYAFRRSYGAERFSIVLNFAPDSRPLGVSGRVVLSSDAARDPGLVTASTPLFAYEGVVLRHDTP